MQTEKKIYSSLSLATKAGKMESGGFATEKAVKSGKAFLVLVAEDASQNTKKMFQNMCVFYEVPFVIFGVGDELGHAIGREFRVSMAVTDEGFARMIKKQLCSEGIGGNE